MSCVSCIPSISMSWASCGLLGNFTEKTLNLARNQNIQITTTIKFCIHQFSKNDRSKDTNSLKLKGWKKMLHINSNQKGVRVAILILDKILL